MDIDGPTLRQMRLTQNMKQAYLAELIGVDQATISRWERGTSLIPEHMKAAISDLIDGVASIDDNEPLRRLIRSSSLKVHLICDRTHRLIDASPSRFEEWESSFEELAGVSMLPFATPEILNAERLLDQFGWTKRFDCRHVFTTSGNDHPTVTIPPSCVVWERVRLANGLAGRLVTTIEDDEFKTLKGMVPTAATRRLG